MMEYYTAITNYGIDSFGIGQMYNTYAQATKVGYKAAGILLHIYRKYLSTCVSA